MSSILKILEKRSSFYTFAIQSLSAPVKLVQVIEILYVSDEVNFAQYILLKFFDKFHLTTK
jgi:hypothetical protein